MREKGIERDREGEGEREKEREDIKRPVSVDRNRES